MPFLSESWEATGVFDRFLRLFMVPIIRCLNSRVIVTGMSGTGEFTQNGLYLELTGTACTGTVYLGGTKYTVGTSLPWIRVRRDALTVENHAGPPPEPFPPGEEWYEVANTPGDIHVPLMF